MSNGFDWVRLWHELPTDPKFRTVSKAAKQPLCAVISVYIYLLVDASCNAVKRGVTQCNAEDISSALDLEIEQVESIKKAMEGRLLEKNYLMGWEKRQPKREDDSVERVRKYRNNKEITENYEDYVTQCNAVKRSVTQCNAPDKEKEKEREREKKVLPRFKNTTSEQGTIGAELKKSALALAIPAEPIFLSIPLLGGTDFPITETLATDFQKSYPAVNVREKIRQMRMWSIANPAKKKTKRGILRFINSWLSREHDRLPTKLESRNKTVLEKNQEVLDQVFQEEQERMRRAEEMKDVDE
jgi:hypothetical protein